MKPHYARGKRPGLADASAPRAAWPQPLLYHICVGRPTTGDRMAFAEAVSRRLKKKICLHCNVTNAAGATRCRKCHRSELRIKAVEARGGA